LKTVKLMLVESRPTRTLVRSPHRERGAAN
jgi:hypothetical protein